MKNLKTLSSAVLLSLVVSVPAFAQVDTSFVAGMQSDILGAVAAIGTALLIAGGSVLAYKWAKGFIFG